MTTYSLYSGSGPALNTYAGPFQAGIAFKVTQGGMWFNSFRWWVPAGGDTAAQKFGLWCIAADAVTGNQLVASVTSGTLTAGQWNVISLAAPVQLSIGAAYVAATGWTAVNGFPVLNSQFASGDPFASGITNGPLFAYADGTAGGSPGTPILGPQGLFGDTSGQTDPTVYMPVIGSSSANFGMDVVVSSSPPAGFAGSWRIWPNFGSPSALYSNDVDLNVAYILGTKFSLSQACTLDKIWFYSPPTATSLPTQCAIWNDTAQTMVPGSLNTSPAWSGAAGSGWISCSYGSLVLPAGNYIVSVWNQSAPGSGTGWNLFTPQYFTTLDGGSGIVSGPITVPNAASANPGQCVYQQSSATFLYPNQYVSVSTPGQCYWTDAEFTVAPVTANPAGLLVVDESFLLDFVLGET